MKPIKQLLRQPMKTLSGIILVALAVAILCVCVGQAAVAANMEDNLDDISTSSALVNNYYLFNYQIGAGWVTTYDQPDEAVQWMYDMAQQYPEIIEGVNRPGLASAYIPQLTADNHTQSFHPSFTFYPYSKAISISTSNTNYCQTILEITLDAIGTEFEKYIMDAYHNKLDGVSVELTGTIESVVGLQEGYADPAGFTIRITLVLPNKDALNMMGLETGQRYLVYGMDYTDLDWELRNDIAVDGYGLGSDLGLENPQIEKFDPENLKCYGEDNYIYSYLQSFDKGIDRVRGIRLGEADLKRFRSVQLTVLDLSTMNIGAGGYPVPTIAKLDGTVKDFLKSDQGVLWQTYLDYIEINNHCFAVIGVDNLMATGDFALQNTTITSGRNFTDQEMQNGARVCVISEDVAARSGLSVGDTITLRYYSIDENNPYQNRISEGYGTANPSAYTYCATTDFTGKGERYTIVGLYGRTLSWQGDNSPYDFRVNTVFVPKASVKGEMDYGETGIFLSLILQNGKLEHFEVLASRDDYFKLFKTTDQGYESVKYDLQNYGLIAQQAVAIGVVVYAILLALFLLFYPAMQRMTLAVMAKIGASQKEMLKYMMIACLGILLPGTVVGMVLCAGLWDSVVAGLTEASRTTIDLKLDLWVVLGIAGLHLILASSLSLLLGFFLALNKNLMNRPKLRISIPGLRRLPMVKVGVAVFAAAVALGLCVLAAATEAEYENYEVAIQEVELDVSVVSKNSLDSHNLNADSYYVELLYYDRFGFSLVPYLRDMQYMTKLECKSINWEPYEKEIWGISAAAQPKELSALMEAEISWYEGYSVDCLDSTDTMYLLVPESMECVDFKEETPGVQLVMFFNIAREYACYATVAGTYTNSIDSQTIYCSFEPLVVCCEKTRASVNLQYFSAIVADNDAIEALRKEANKCFIDWETGENGTIFSSSYIFRINKEPLERLAITLKTNIRFHELCATLIFALSAGAGFFLGFLMIRSRKREIILMRTLGRANFSIYLSYAFEQMLCILAGAALGGLAFQWHPIERLGIFVGIYFVGLSAALILFLNSRLLTNVKEDE